MPKILEQPQQRLIEEARHQIAQNGYCRTTIRSIAKGCGIAVGTVYNYFPSKETLVASLLLEDWKQCLQVIHDHAQRANCAEPVAQCIYHQLQSFYLRHETIFQDAANAGGLFASYSQYHSLLRSQLAAPLERFCRDSFTAEFAAESLLTWTMEGIPCNRIWQVLSRLFDK